MGEMRLLPPAAAADCFCTLEINGKLSLLSNSSPQRLTDRFQRFYSEINKGYRKKAFCYIEFPASFFLNYIFQMRRSGWLQEEPHNPKRPATERFHPVCYITRNVLASPSEICLTVELKRRWQMLQEMICFFLRGWGTPNVWLITAFWTGSIWETNDQQKQREPEMQVCLKREGIPSKQKL